MAVLRMGVTEMRIPAPISAWTAEQVVNWFPQKRVKAHVSGNRRLKAPAILNDR
jgi:hypothetical protein